MAKTFTISTVASDKPRVLLFERHKNHPNGEVVVASDGRSYEVGDTAAVRNLLSLTDDGDEPVAVRGKRKATADEDTEPDVPGQGGAGGENPGFAQGGEDPGKTPDKTGTENTGSAFTAEAQKDAEKSRKSTAKPRL